MDEFRASRLCGRPGRMLGPPSIPWPPTARGGWTGEPGFVSESLPVLAGVLRAAPESDALVILGRLLDSLPIPVVLTDCSNELRCVYGNAAWRAWVPGEKFPVEGQPLPEILERLGDSPLLPILRQVC